MVTTLSALRARSRREGLLDRRRDRAGTGRALRSGGATAPTVGTVVRAAAEVLSAGDVLGGRYRLERRVGAGRAPAGTGLWQAADLILERPVAIRTVVDPSPVVRSALLLAAARASAAHDPRIAATYDAAEQDTPLGPVAYLIREWVDGQPLSTQLVGVGLDPIRLHTVLRNVALAVAALHADGGWHGRIHPDNLLVLADDSVRLTDPGTAVALAAAGLPGAGDAVGPPPLPPAVVADLGLGPRPRDPGGDAALLRRCQRYDTCDLGRVLYAATTGTWVGAAWRDMPAAPGDGLRPLAPRQVRAAVPRDLDAVVRRVLLPEPGRQAALQDADAVAASLTRDDPAPPDPAQPRAHRRRRRPRPLALVGLLVLTLLLLAAVGFSLGKRIGTVPGTNSGLPVLSPAPTVRGSAGPGGVLIPLKVVTAFDPPPGDGQENDDQVPLAYDGSTATGWQTATYRSAALGNLKSGVGLLVDLGTARRVGTVQVALIGSGTSLQLRAGNTAAATAAGFPVLAQQTGAGTTVTFTPAATDRYWLLWLTQLPTVPGGYRGEVAELVFRS